MITPQGEFQQTVCRSVSEAFEVMAFEEVLLQGVREEPFPDMQAVNVLWACIDIAVPSWGRSVLGIPRELLNRLAEAIHGLPWSELSFEQILDAQGELLNTILGRILANLIPTDDTFQMGLPLLGVEHLPPNHPPVVEFTFLIQDHNIKLYVPQQAKLRSRKE